jgi:hypothetical protein
VSGALCVAYFKRKRERRERKYEESREEHPAGEDEEDRDHAKELRRPNEIRNRAGKLIRETTRAVPYRRESEAENGNTDNEDEKNADDPVKDAQAF